MIGEPDLCMIGEPDLREPDLTKAFVASKSLIQGSDTAWLCGLDLQALPNRAEPKLFE